MRYINLRFIVLFAIALLLCGCSKQSDSISPDECSKICCEILADTAELPCEDIFAENCTKTYRGYMYLCSSVDIKELNYLQSEENSYVALCNARGISDEGIAYHSEIFKIIFKLNAEDKVELAEVYVYDVQ